MEYLSSWNRGYDIYIYIVDIYIYIYHIYLYNCLVCRYIMYTCFHKQAFNQPFMVFLLGISNQGVAATKLTVWSHQGAGQQQAADMFPKPPVVPVILTHTQTFGDYEL